jgi:hypothetical protein
MLLLFFIRSTSYFEVFCFLFPKESKIRNINLQNRSFIFLFSASFNMGRGAQTTLSQRMSIIHWLQEKKNFKLITGQATNGAPVVAGSKVKSPTPLNH